MTRSDAERATVMEWRKWARDNLAGTRPRTSFHAMGFFQWLQSERPQLLSFPHAGDKWPLARSWLLRDREIVD